MLDNTIVGAYLLFILALGIWAGRGLKNLREYSVVRRQYGALVIFATLSASFIGGGFSFGNASKVFLFGVANVVALWGFSLKEILVARFIAPRMDAFPDRISVGDVMAIHYGRLGQVVTGLLGVMVCAGIVGAQVGAIGTVFTEFMGVERFPGIVLGCGIVIIYTTVGGMRAIVLTDIVQFIVLALGIPLALVMGVISVGGLGELRAAVPADHFALFSENMTPIMLLSLFLSFVLGETLVPPYVQRLLLGRNAAETARGTLLSGLFSIPFFAITGAIGLVALAMSPDLESNLAMPYVIRNALPIGLRGVVVAGVISIVMSSADSFLNAAAVAFISDVVNPLRKTELSDEAGLALARLATLFTGVAAVVFALSIKNVLDILLFSYNFWSPVVLVPLIATFLGLKPTLRTFLAGAIAGAGALLIWQFALGNPLGFDALVIGVLANLIAFTVAYRLRGEETAA